MIAPPLDPRLPKVSACAAILLLTGCSGTPLDSEREVRSDVEAVSRRFRPDDAPPVLPELTPASPLEDFLRYALLRNPRVEAAYFDWAASVERIAPARSPPDPRLTFSADLADTVMGLMPGLMVDLPGPGKLRAAGEVAAAESRVGYFAFEREILGTALAVKTAYYRLRFLEETIGVQRETLRLLEDLERIARQQNAVGRATLQDALRAQIARDQVESQIANLEDSRAALAAEWKSALGLGPAAPDPPLPESFEPSTGEPDPDSLLATALDRNPDLRAMESDVRRAEAALALARKSGVPDFSLGFEFDIRVDSMRADPTMFTPSAGVSLPIWRDRIAAEIAGAQAGKRAAEARLSAEQVRLAAEFAGMLYELREASRDEALLREKLVPRARESLEAARSGYENGRAGFLDVIEAQRALLEFELAGIEARTRRELALAVLSLAVAGIPPAGAPLPHAEEIEP